MIELPFIDLARPVRAESPLARGLVTWWLSVPGLDGGPRLYDLAGLRHGVISQTSAAPAWTSAKQRPGALASSLNLSAATSRVNGAGGLTAGTNPYAAACNGGDYTFAQWVRIDSSGVTAGALATVADATASGYGLLSYRIPAGDVWRVYITGTSFNLAGAAPADGRWRHYVVVRTGGTLYRYINGLSAAAPVSAPYSTTVQADGIQFGNYTPGFAAYQLSGAWDDVRYYSRGLSADEVRELYCDSLAGCPALLNRVRLVPPYLDTGPPPPPPFLFRRGYWPVWKQDDPGVTWSAGDPGQTWTLEDPGATWSLNGAPDMQEPIHREVYPDWERRMEFDFARFAELKAGETIVSATITCDPAGPTFSASGAISGSKVQTAVVPPVGAAGKSYLFKCKIVTSGGRKLSLFGYYDVEPEPAAPAP